MQYLSQEKFDELKKELENLKSTKMPDIAKRIDEARQQGDLSENAEYHAAREEMSWAKGRELELNKILDEAQIVSHGNKTNKIEIGSKIVVRKEVQDSVPEQEKEYEIVGIQEADPLNGKISNESPLGDAFLGKKEGDEVELKLADKIQKFKILSVK